MEFQRLGTQIIEVTLSYLLTYSRTSELTYSRTSVNLLTVELVELKEHSYSRTSVARTLMAHLPRLFRARSYVPRKKIT